MIDTLEVQQVPVEHVIPLRHAILRKGLPLRSCYYEEDAIHGTFHLAAYIDDRLVGISSFYPEEHPDLDQLPAPQFRIRGMASLDEYRRKGIGSSLLKRGERIVKERGGKLLWCNARTNAIPFYEKLGFEVSGGEFDIPGIGPHYLLFRALP